MKVDVSKTVSKHGKARAVIKLLDATDEDVRLVADLAKAIAASAPDGMLREGLRASADRAMAEGVAKDVADALDFGVDRAVHARAPTEVHHEGATWCGAPYGPATSTAGYWKDVTCDECAAEARRRGYR